jgi:hypothetical protein
MKLEKGRNEREKGSVTKLESGKGSYHGICLDTMGQKKLLWSLTSVIGSFEIFSNPTSYSASFCNTNSPLVSS